MTNRKNLFKPLGFNDKDAFHQFLIAQGQPQRRADRGGIRSKASRMVLTSKSRCRPDILSVGKRKSVLQQVTVEFILQNHFSTVRYIGAVTQKFRMKRQRFSIRLCLRRKNGIFCFCNKIFLRQSCFFVCGRDIINSGTKLFPVKDLADLVFIAARISFSVSILRPLLNILI